MENQRRCRLVAGLVCLLALFIVGPVMAEQSQASSVGVSCLASTVQTPQPIWLESTLGCHTLSHCLDDDYCWERCSTAITAACVNNVCQYTLPGPGNPGSGCPYEGRCSEDFHCTFPGGITGTCVNGGCVCE